jgi:hypothetical protein
VTWSGIVYGGSLRRRGRRTIDYGVWGQGLFQTACEPRSAATAVAPLMPESYMALLGLAAAAAISPWDSPLSVFGVPLMVLMLAVAMLALCGRALVAAAHVVRASGADGRRPALETALVAALVLLQPAARLSGRIRAGLTPWRRRPSPHGIFAPARVRSLWCEHGQSPANWLTVLEAQLGAAHAVVARGSQYDRWDLLVRVGSTGGARVQLAVEEHGHGRQLLRWRVTPRPAGRWVAAVVVLAIAAAAGAAAAGAIVAIPTAALALGIAGRVAGDCVLGRAAIDAALSGWTEPDLPQLNRTPLAVPVRDGR